MYTKNALGNLKNRYIAVLKKCALINIFGSLAVATLLAAPSLSFANALITENDSVLNNSDTLTGAIENLSGFGYFVGMFAYSPGDINYVFTNYADGIIDLKSANSVISAMVAEAYNGNHMLTNYGTINAVSAGYVEAMAAYADNDGSHTLINEGTITAISTNRQAYAMYAYADSDGSHTLTNNGTVTATSTNSEAYGMSASSIDEGNHKLTNNETITATSIDGYAYGMHANGVGNHSLTNNGTVTATTQRNSAYGMYINDNGDHRLTNSGTINAINNGAANFTYAYGMYISGDGDHVLTNNGTISTTSASDKAYGMYISGEGSHTVINNGTVTSNSEEDAFGMRVYSDSVDVNTLTNNGTITAASTDASAFGIYSGAKGNRTLTNSGTIIATSTGTSTTNKNAYGMCVVNTDGALINNTGIITSKSSQGVAYEVSGIVSYNIGTYATTLRNWTLDDAVFGTNSSAAEVSFDNSTLILRPGTIAQGFEYGNEYKVTDMIVYNKIKNPDEIEGSIQNVKAEVPFLLASLDNSEPTKPTISLNTNVNKDTVTPTQLAKLSSSKMHNTVTKIANRKINKMIEKRMAKNLKKNLRNLSEKAYEQGVIVAGDIITYVPSYQEKNWEIYVDAYAGYTGNNEDNFGTHTKGMTLGAEKALSDKLNLGFAMDFSDSTTDGQDGLLADSTDITFAANADYFINPNWYVSGTMALNLGENDMDYMISPTLYAKDDFSSQAFYMAVNTGYLYEINENNIIVPEIGLSYLYTQSRDIDVDFAGSDIYDMHIANDSFSALYANLMVTWQGQYELARGILRPSVGLGIRQNLNNADFDSRVQALGFNFDTVVTEDKTSFITNLGLDWQKGNFSMGISYSGGFGSEQQSHLGNIKFRYEF